MMASNRVSEVLSVGAKWRARMAPAVRMMPRMTAAVEARMSQMRCDWVRLNLGLARVVVARVGRRVGLVPRGLVPGGLGRGGFGSIGFFEGLREVLLQLPL
jgi:hypothetical protein